MKILQTPARFHPYIGGVENYVCNLSRELVKSGHEIKIICANEPKSTKGIEGIKIRRLDYFGKIANTNITPSLPFSILNENFDVLHTHLPTPWSADWSAVISAAKRKPLVLTYHNDIVGNGTADYAANVYNLTALKFLLKRAANILIYHSKYLEFSPHLQMYKKKIKIVPAGVNIEKFQPADIGAEDTIFFLSLLDEFHRYKGLDYLLEAMRLVKKDIPGVKLKIGGGGKLLEYYKRKAFSFDLEKNVEFLGYVPDDSTPEHYRDCSLFVLPSISASQEGFGIVLLEALASERPVVCTDIAGLSGDIEKYNAGIVVKPRDTNMLADAIIRLLNDKREAKRTGERGRKLVEERYTWGKVCKAVEDIYQDVV